MNRPTYPGSSYNEWRAVAGRLRWRDRITVSWANSRGRAAPPRLAQVAVKRGELLIAALERTIHEGSGYRKFWLVLGVIGLVLCVLNLALLIVGGSWYLWIQVITSGLMGAWFLSVPRRQHRLLGRVRQSVILNRQVAATDKAPTSNEQA
jgi:hypothetical protein